MKNNFFKQFKAKSDGTTLTEHTMAVIDRGLELIQSLSLKEVEKQNLQEKFIIVAVLHDLGKIHPYFQRRLKGETVTIRHEIVSLWFCLTYLNLDRTILFALATHHKDVVNRANPKSFSLEDLTELDDIYAKSNGTMTASILKQWLNSFSLVIPFKETIIENPSLDNTFVNLLRSNKQESVSDLTERKSFSLLRALLQTADHIASAGVDHIPAYTPIEPKQFQPRDKQNNLLPFRHFQILMQSWIGDVILHAPTGSGKTEAALSWIYANQTENNRLIYLLPYTASINAMVVRLQEVYAKQEVIVQHSKSLDYIYDELVNETSNKCVDYQQTETKARKLNSLTREIYYPIKVATLHQILRTSLRGKGWEFSLLEYKNSLFIIDEFHAYNALLTGMLIATVRMFKRLFEAKFMFMSATIPDFLLHKIIDEVYNGDSSRLLRPDSSFDSDAAVLNRKRHHLICRKDENIYSSIPIIKSSLEKGLSVLVIVNNVKTCQEIYKKIDFDGKKRMLHGGFNLRSRKAIESDITNKDYSLRPQLLVATQAVEVSLDIDYNIAFVENAPIDALIQRFGRVNRAGNLCDDKGNKRMAPIYLYEQIAGKTPFYDKILLETTWDNLLSLNNYDLSENDLIGVCNQVYKNGYSEEQNLNFEQGLNHPVINSFDYKWIAADRKDWIENILESNNQKIDVLCYNLYDEYTKLIMDKRYIEANQLLVSVYPYTKQKATKIGNDSVIIANGLFYNEDIGCIIEPPETYEII